ncbi:MAG: LysM peptidoglycan-binding domain-containing protein [Bacteroidota bacterium]
MKPVFRAQLVEDSISSPKFMNELIRYQNYYPFINYNRNYIEWTNLAAIDSFFRKIPKTPRRKLKILHIGDSHLQADIPSGYIRERLQDIFGYGGRGLIFPYRAAGTHSAYDYKTYCTGIWEWTRNTQREAVFDMGLIGATIHTKDSAASFKIVFRDGFIRDNFSVIKLYCKQDSLSYDIKLKTNSGSLPIYVDCSDNAAKKPYILISLSKASDTIEVTMNKTNKKQNFFECYGLMIESRENSGVLYCSTGINGAGYKSILKQRIFETQIAEFCPDLVILDLGANDFYGGAFNTAEMESNLVKIIDIIQRATPSTSIIISNSQDILYRRKRDIVECKDFMEVTRRVAEYRKCAFYNYYDVSGNKGSMNLWYKRGLSKPDKIHLTTPGYYTKGELYLNAILNSYVLWLKSKSDSLVAEKHALDTTQLKKYFVEELNFKKENTKVEPTVVYTEPENDTEGTDRRYYTIRSGDNLGAIAERHGVSVKDLQYWNGLSGTKIIAGESLVIYKKSHVPAVNPVPKSVEKTSVPQNQTAIKPTNETRPGQRKAVYKVASGDSLWSIARKYNTTVDKIKQLNKLKTEKLSIGQTLLIP